MSIQIEASFPDSIEFSFEQINISLCDSLGLTNNAPEPLGDLVLEFSLTSESLEYESSKP
jgi:hypothetical protein